MFLSIRVKRAILLLFYIITSVLIFENLSLATELPKGIGPIKELKLETLNIDLATSGKNIFMSKCSMCHKIDERYVGPALKGVTKRRAPEWIMNMILNTEIMVEQDATAQELLAEYLVKMTSQNVSNDEARSILEYFRYYEEKGDIQIMTKKIEQKIKKAAKK